MLERETIVAEVAKAAIEEMKGRCLVINDLVHQIYVPEGDRWNRYAFQSKETSLWPEGTYDNILIRVHIEKISMELLVHAALSALNPGGTLWFVGGNNEGIKSIPKRFSALLPDIKTIDIRKRCRVLRTRKPAETLDICSSLDEWWKKEGFLNREWMSLPGCFAKGKLDAGTALLLEVLPGLKANRRVLDYACGIGIISHEVRRHFPEVGIDALDFDLYAIESARRNVQDIPFFVSDGWQGLPNDRRYDLIISNPPLHRGKAEDRETLSSLISGAKSRLYRQGSLVLVVRRQLPVQRQLEEHFHRVDLLKKNNHFWVWRAKP
jgi:16S rRNA (guanine1207-N2)-methyltransferase